MGKLPRRPVVTFKIADNIPQLILDASAIVGAMTINIATFPSPAPTLAVFSANITALKNTETRWLNRKGSVQDRELARTAVKYNILSLKMYVQALVNAAPDHAEAIAAKADMKIRIKNPRKKVVFHAKNNVVSGVVDLYAGGGPQRSFHEWAISPNNIKWTDLAPTNLAKTQVKGLAPMSKQYFRHRLYTAKDGMGNWEQSFSIIIT